MPICRKVKIDFDYFFDNIILSRVTEFNELGITITTNLSWCENVHSTMGMIKRYVGFNSPPDVKRQLYLAHVRSIVLEAQQGMLFKLPLCKTVQFQCSYFYRTACSWNNLPFVI